MGSRHQRHNEKGATTKVTEEWVDSCTCALETQGIEGMVEIFGKEAAEYWPCQTLFIQAGWTCQFTSFVFGHIGDEDDGSAQRVRGMFVFTDVCLSQRPFISHHDAGACVQRGHKRSQHEIHFIFF